MTQSDGDDDDLTALADVVDEFVTAKIARQNGLATYYDHQIRSSVGDARRAVDSPADVQASNRARRQLEPFLDLISGPRFLDPLPRLRRPDKQVLAEMGAGLKVFLAAQGKKDHLTWANRPLFKTAFDLAAYPMLIAELAPQSVIELGSGSGGSAVWMADIAAAHGVNPNIVSVDRSPVSVGDERITFLTGDIAQLAELLPNELTATLPRPWLVIEDAHVHVGSVLHFFDAHLAPGDYMIVEDSLSKRTSLRAFLERTPHTYRLDTRYLDLFGENTTCAIDSIFRRY